MARVLVAISQREVSLVIQEVLDLSNYDTACFETEAECLHAVQNTRFDAVLLGIVQTPVLEQLDLAHALHLYDPTLPLVLIIGRDQPQLNRHIAKIPFSIIRAPFSPQDLIETMAQSAR